MRRRLLRTLVLFLTGWPLLMPPGVCVCQFVKAGEVASCPTVTKAAECQSAEDDGDACCPDPCYVREKANSGPCADKGKGAPSKPECPTGCPASRKSEHLRLAEHQHLTGVSLATLTPLPFFVAPRISESHTTLSLTSPPPVPPIYLSLCTLLI